jgi:WD40 repeat protein
LATFEPVATLTNRGSIYNFRFSPDGEEVAVASGRQIAFWSTSTWQRKREISGFMDILYSPDGRNLWLAKDYRTAGLYDAESLRLVLPLPTGMLPLALSTDGRQLAVSMDLRRIQVWDLAEVRRQLGKLDLDWKE